MAKKRKTFLVEKQVQGALGWRICAHWFIFLGLSVSVTCALQMLGNFAQASLWERFEAAILGQLGSIVVLLALLPWFVHDSLKLSNRFAGPMVRLKKSIIALTNEADTAPVVFRNGDFWQEIATEFNQLRLRVSAEREQLLKLKGHSDVTVVPTAADDSGESTAILPALPMLSGGFNTTAGCN